MAGARVHMIISGRVQGVVFRYSTKDEADRWRWANEFVLALNRGDLAATLVGDGYPGILPVWAESIWILIEAVRRSLVEGQWIGEAGLGHLLHEWDRTEMLFQQRLPIVLLNILIALAIVWIVWQLFGQRVALVIGNGGTIADFEGLHTHSTFFLMKFSHHI